MAKKRYYDEKVLQDAATATGDGGIVDAAGFENGVFQVSGTFVGTITFEGSQDETNWIALALADLNSTTRARSTTATAPGLFLLDSVGGLKRVRARISAYTSGSITVKAGGIA